MKVSLVQDVKKDKCTKQLEQSMLKTVNNLTGIVKNVLTANGFQTTYQIGGKKMKREFIWAIGGTIAMAIIACAVSYGTLYELAINHRIVVAFLFPVMIDGTMALSMFIRVYFAKIGKKTYLPAMILGFFTFTSIVLNALGAHNFTEQYIYAIAPIAVFACTELCAIIVEKTPVIRKSTRKTTGSNKPTRLYKE